MGYLEGHWSRSIVLLERPLFSRSRNHPFESGQSEETKSRSNALPTVPVAGIANRFAQQASAWTPASFLRAKNIGDFTWNQQLELFADVLPELESRIQAKLSPVLRDAMSAASREYLLTSGNEPRAIAPH